MENNKEEAAQFIKNEMRKLNIITTPGSVALGLGVYGKFAANGRAFHPILDNENVVMGLLVFGVGTILYSLYKVRKIISVNKRD